LGVWEIEGVSHGIFEFPFPGRLFNFNFKVLKGKVSKGKFTLYFPENLVTGILNPQGKFFKGNFFWEGEFGNF